MRGTPVEIVIRQAADGSYTFKGAPEDAVYWKTAEVEAAVEAKYPGATVTYHMDVVQP